MDPQVRAGNLPFGRLDPFGRGGLTALQRLLQRHQARFQRNRAGFERLKVQGGFALQRSAAPGSERVKSSVGGLASVACV